MFDIIRALQNKEANFFFTNFYRERDCIIYPLRSDFLIPFVCGCGYSYYSTASNNGTRKNWSNRLAKGNPKQNLIFQLKPSICWEFAWPKLRTVILGSANQCKVYAMAVSKQSAVYQEQVSSFSEKKKTVGEKWFNV